MPILAIVSDRMKSLDSVLRRLYRSCVAHSASYQTLVALAILIFIATAGAYADSPVRSLVPYAFAVMLVTWRHGAVAGVLVAGLACLAALVAGAFPTRPQWAGHLLEEGLVTYLKLSAVALGVCLAKWSHRALRRS